MVEFLNTSKAYAGIEDVIDKADSKVVLISPYIRFPKPLLERLKYKDKQGIKTVVVCRENDLGKNLGDEVKSDLKQLRNLELRFDDDLHAKCFYNEKSMVITSLNLLESSERKNREMGVLLSSEEDSNVFKDALNEAEFIVSNAKKDSLIGSLVRDFVKETKSVVESQTKDTLKRTKTTTRTKQKGYCIRCGKNIPYDRDKPYCLNCARSWKISGATEIKQKNIATCVGNKYANPQQKILRYVVLVTGNHALRTVLRRAVHHRTLGYPKTSLTRGFSLHALLYPFQIILIAADGMFFSDNG